jgi:hemerythrin-like domain-containing protein
VKRHGALEPLSRDHHHALVAAQQLRRASESTATDARDRFRDYWDQEGREHFREEEEILLPMCAPFVDPEHRLVLKVLSDHVRIRHLAGEATASSAPPLSVLHDLGHQLEQHVRLEERELFPLIERSLPEEQLARLVELLAH